MTPLYSIALTIFCLAVVVAFMFLFSVLTDILKRLRSIEQAMEYDPWKPEGESTPTRQYDPKATWHWD